MRARGPPARRRPTKPSAAGAEPPFQLRPGLVAEMMRFYDQLRRQGQSVDRYEELLVESLDADSDRGAERLLRQTRFLAASYRAYEQRLAALPPSTSTALRAHLIQRRPPPIRCGTSSWPSATGLPIRMACSPSISICSRECRASSEIDVVATDRAARIGFRPAHPRLAARARRGRRPRRSACGPRPCRGCVAPDREDGDARVGSRRDREEELVAVARRAGPRRRPRSDPRPWCSRGRCRTSISRARCSAARGFRIRRRHAAARRRAGGGGARSDHRVRLVGVHACRGAGAAPIAAAFVWRARLSRRGLAGLDRGDARAAVSRRDRRLCARSSRTSSGDAEVAPRRGGRRARRGRAAAADELRPRRRQLGCALVDVPRRLARRTQTPASDRRGRAAIVGVLQSLAAAHASHGDHGDRRRIDDLAPDIRRWIEEQTFDRTMEARTGVHLLDAQAARFGDFDDHHHRRPDRRRVARAAAPQHLLLAGRALRHSAGRPNAIGGARRPRPSSICVRSPSRHVVVSTFTFDDEALVEPSILIEEVGGCALSTVETPAPPERVFVDEALSVDPVQLDALDADAREWAAFRRRAAAERSAAYHGAAGPQPPRALSVSAIETYLTCPFKYLRAAT